MSGFIAPCEVVASRRWKFSPTSLVNSACGHWSKHDLCMLQLQSANKVCEESVSKHLLVWVLQCVNGSGGFSQPLEQVFQRLWVWKNSDRCCGQSPAKPPAYIMMASRNMLTCVLSWGSFAHSDQSVQIPATLHLYKMSSRIQLHACMYVCMYVCLHVCMREKTWEAKLLYAKGQQRKNYSSWSTCKLSWKIAPWQERVLRYMAQRSLRAKDSLTAFCIIHIHSQMGDVTKAMRPCKASASLLRMDLR